MAVIHSYSAVTKYTLNFQKAEEIPTVCMAHIKKLIAQPESNGKGLVDYKCKILSLVSYIDGLIFEILSRNAKELINHYIGNNSTYNIHAFNRRVFQFHDGIQVPNERDWSLKIEDHNEQSFTSTKALYEEIYSHGNRLECNKRRGSWD